MKDLLQECLSGDAVSEIWARTVKNCCRRCWKNLLRDGSQVVGRSGRLRRSQWRTVTDWLQTFNT